MVFYSERFRFPSRGEVVGDRKDLYLIVDLSAKLLRDKGITGFYYQGTRDWKDYQRMYNQMVVDHSDKDLYKKGLEYLSIVKRLYSSKGVVIDNDSMKMMYMYVMHMNEKISGNLGMLRFMRVCIVERWSFGRMIIIFHFRGFMVVV